jgi:hypothetical protein
MRFVMLMIPNVTSENWTPSSEAVEAMGAYNEQLRQAGVLLSLDGLHPTSRGARVFFASGGGPTIAEGPFDTPQQTVGGYWLIDVGSKEEAVKWASRCPAADGDVIEVRRVFEMSDFPPEVQAAASAAEGGQ